MITLCDSEMQYSKPSTIYKTKFYDQNRPTRQSN